MSIRNSAGRPRKLRIWVIVVISAPAIAVIEVRLLCVSVEHIRELNNYNLVKILVWVENLPRGAKRYLGTSGILASLALCFNTYGVAKEASRSKVTQPPPQWRDTTEAMRYKQGVYACDIEGA